MSIYRGEGGYDKYLRDRLPGDMESITRVVEQTSKLSLKDRWAIIDVFKFHLNPDSAVRVNQLYKYGLHHESIPRIDLSKTSFDVAVNLIRYFESDKDSLFSLLRGFLKENTSEGDGAYDKYLQERLAGDIKSLTKLIEKTSKFSIEDLHVIMDAFMFDFKLEPSGRSNQLYAWGFQPEDIPRIDLRGASIDVAGRIVTYFQSDQDSLIDLLKGFLKEKEFLK